ncbi:MAG TPA: hypothetical protein VGF17_28270, partial [Phytomonospora sp.]
MGDSFIGTQTIDAETAARLAASIAVRANRLADWPEVSERVIEVGERLRKSAIGRRFSWQHPLKETAAGEYLAGLSTEDLRAAGLWAMFTRWTGGTDRGHIDFCHAVTDLIAARRLAWTTAEVAILFACAARYRPEYDLPVVLKLPVTAATRLGDDELRPLREAILAARTRTAEAFEDMNP